MGRSFARRSIETELMDTEAVGLDDYRACLADLAQVNALTLTHGPILRWLDRATKKLGSNDRVTILDVGYGYGDLLRRIYSWSVRSGRHVDLLGIDLNPLSESIARAETSTEAPIEYRTGNVFDFTPDRPIDFVISSQTAHHLSDEELVAFVVWLERSAKRGWFIADLHRHTIPYHAFRLLSRFARWHRFIQHDGPVSIARSFRREDWRGVLNDAGIPSAGTSVRWHVPFRLCVSRLR